jgi:hypothetical protein
MTTLRASFATPAALVAAHDQEITRGGLLVRGAVPADATLFAEVELEIVAGGRRVSTRAQIVQMVPGVGVAVTFAAAAVAGLAELVSAARALGAGAWPEPGAAKPGAAAAPAAASPAAKLRDASVAEKIQIALHGSRDERQLILRDTNRLLHPYLLKNPNLQMEEVAAMARMSAVSPEVLKLIVDRREWVSRPDIAIALVRNPTVPVPLALRALEHVSPADLRQLAKDSKTRPAIQQAARRKVVG